MTGSGNSIRSRMIGLVGDRSACRRWSCSLRPDDGDDVAGTCASLISSRRVGVHQQHAADALALAFDGIENRRVLEPGEGVRAVDARVKVRPLKEGWTPEIRDLPGGARARG